ncbi:Rv0361 family membrane protein [Mycobacterium sp. C31M]
MTYYPPQQPGPPGPWDPRQQPPQQAYEYPAYDVAPPAQQQPYGYGFPPPGYPYPPQPPRKNNTTWWILGGVTTILVVAALVIGGVFLLRNSDDILASGDEAEIQQLVQDFSAAGSTGKFSDLGQYFCAAEAGMFSALGELGQILEGIEVPQTAPTTDLSATDIKVKGDVASANMGANGPFETAYFRKENGKWKVCMSAAVEFSQR